MAIAKSLIVRALIIYFITSFFRRPAPNTNSSQSNVPSFAAKNLLDNGSEIALHVYLSESENNPNFKETPFWLKDNLVYGDWISGPNSDGSYTFEQEIEITDHMRKNGSVYIHAFITKRGRSPNPSASNYDKNFISYTKKPINRYVQLSTLLIGFSTLLYFLAGTKNSKQV